MRIITLSHSRIPTALFFPLRNLQFGAHYSPYGHLIIEERRYAWITEEVKEASMNDTKKAFTIYAMDYLDEVTGIISVFEYGIN